MVLVWQKELLVQLKKFLLRDGSDRASYRGNRWHRLLRMESLNALLQDRTMSSGIDQRFGYYQLRIKEREFQEPQLVPSRV